MTIPRPSSQPPNPGRDDYVGQHRRIEPILWQLGSRTQRPHHPNGWDNGR